MQSDYFNYNYSDIIYDHVKDSLIRGSSEYFYLINNESFYQFYIYNLISFAKTNARFKIHTSSELEKRMLEQIILEINNVLWMVNKFHLTGKNKDTICVFDLYTTHMYHSYGMRAPC